MTRRLLLFGTLGLGVIIGLVFVLLGGSNEEDYEVNIEQYCENNSDTAFCGNHDSSETTIVLDMIDKLIVEYSVGYNDQLCEDYFYGKIENYCKDSKENMLPSQVTYLSDTYKIEEVYGSTGELKEGIYDVYTTYSSGLDAYVIRVALVRENGIPVISGLSYNRTPERTNLYLYPALIESFIEEMILNTEEEDFCLSHFTGDAYVSCNNDINDVIQDVTYNNATEPIEIDTNEFIVTMIKDGETSSISLQVLFERVEGELRISQIATID